jgi:Tol biopolymer transport system component
VRKAAFFASVIYLAFLFPAPGKATNPGGNGLIAFTNVHSEDIFVMNGDGSLPGAFVNNKSYYENDPAWSPDGTKMAFVTSRFADAAPDYDIEIINSDRTGQHALTDTAADERYPVFSPDGTRIAFLKRTGGVSDLFVMNSDGSGVQQLTEDGDIEGPIDWRSDGDAIVFTIENDFGKNISQYSFTTTLVTPLTPVGDQEDVSPSYSPDGTQVAYVRMPLLGGDPSLRVINVNGTWDHASPAGQDSSTEVTWSPDGASLLVQENPNSPTTAIVDPEAAGRTIISNEYAQNLDWQPCPDDVCSVAPPRISITEVTLAVRNSRDLNVFTEVRPILQGEPILVTLFRNEDGRKFIEIGTLQTTIGSDGLAEATFHIGRQGQCRAKSKYLGSDDYLPSKDKGTFSCKGGLAK